MRRGWRGWSVWKWMESRLVAEGWIQLQVADPIGGR